MGRRGMQLLVRYIRIYALHSSSEKNPKSHPGSPIQLNNFPSTSLHSTIHVGAVPDDIMDALKQHHAWIERLPALFGLPAPDNVRNVEEFRRAAADIPDSAVLADERFPGRHFGILRFTLMIISNFLQIPTMRSWAYPRLR